MLLFGRSKGYFPCVHSISQVLLLESVNTIVPVLCEYVEFFAKVMVSVAEVEEPVEGLTVIQEGTVVADQVVFSSAVRFTVKAVE